MKLENGCIQVTFIEPEKILTQRFDHTAIVTQVVLDGIHPFCTQEQVIPLRRSTNGIGLCGEFILDEAWADAKAGEWVCKPGVGLLRQMEDNQLYDMWKTYEARPFEVTMQVRDHEILFQQKAIPCNGYGIDIEKIFHLEDNRLILDIRVRNAGTKECTLKEYQHNFVSIDHYPVGPGYVLELPNDRILNETEKQTLRQGDEIRLPSAVEVQNDQVLWTRNMDGSVLYHRSEEVGQKPPYRWTLQHAESDAAVAEQTDFCPSRIDVWAVEHCVCAEFYHTVHLLPGEPAHWRRTWTFTG